MALPLRRIGAARPSEQHDEGRDTARWEPLTELERLNQQLTSYLDSLRNVPSLLNDAFTPLADLEETEDAYLVEIELPGIKRDDVDIEIAGRRLSVHGERKEKERVGILRRRERTIGRFSYEVTLPGNVDENGIEAHFDNGVLTVRLPKPEHERARRIPIH